MKVKASLPRAIAAGRSARSRNCRLGKVRNETIARNHASREYQYSLCTAATDPDVPLALDDRLLHI
jgi:hypothetical protein